MVCPLSAIELISVDRFFSLFVRGICIGIWDLGPFAVLHDCYSMPCADQGGRCGHQQNVAGINVRTVVLACNGDLRIVCGQSKSNGRIHCG